MSDIPSKIFEREIYQISIREIFEKGEDGNYINFDSTSDRNISTHKYRIPIHQRYNKWNIDAKQIVIDSVYKNYIIGGISFSRHTSNEGDGSFYFDIEDGQSRLTVIQEYLEDKFKYREKLFSERTEHEKNRFLSYVFSTETMTLSKSARSLQDSIGQHYFENFDRINRGASLTDNDKYWCYKDTPFVKFAIDLINKFKTDSNFDFMGAKKFGIISDGKQNRIVLEKICTIVGALVYDIYKKSYSRHYENINNPITEEKKTLINNFMDHYKKICCKIYSDMPKCDREKYIQFNNPGKFLSLIIKDYKTKREGISNQDKVKMWADILNIDRVSPNFMTKGTKTLFNQFTDGDKQNQELSNIIKRLGRVIQFYNNKEYTSQRYHIEYTNYN